ncbi:hypothetical protein [Xenorhabdus eapokensis]|uniref:Uncharacterized protein n=1 Tax=Xenorhabdus eapokensis TaxID=1873482 RepID=A0A1Q5TMY3_9GAMM|nr:hypothetical protein [Xenorhabdus eapokensis]OKP01588.1 hypothetical protein Xedl_02862 [Xenorhabdus eapokensis]
MEITRYTTQTLITLANELNLDLHDCELPYILTRHLYTLQCVIHSDGSSCDYRTILLHTLKSLK